MKAPIRRSLEEQRRQEDIRMKGSEMQQQGGVRRTEQIGNFFFQAEEALLPEEFEKAQNRESKVSHFFRVLMWTARSKQGKTFLRSAADSNSIVMKTPSHRKNPLEAVLKPGSGRFRLSSLAAFQDLQKPVPRHAKMHVDRSSWRSSNAAGESGSFSFSPEQIGAIVPVELATPVLLELCDCDLIASSPQKEIKLQDEHVIQDFTYSNKHFKKCAKEFGGLCAYFAHLDCLLDSMEESGLFILGKWINEGKELYLTTFCVPQLHALFISGEVGHLNDYLCGTWHTMLSWTSKILWVMFA